MCGEDGSWSEALPLCSESPVFSLLRDFPLLRDFLINQQKENKNFGSLQRFMCLENKLNNIG